MSDTPLVSIGVPVYNGERFLARTLDSLLAQSYRHLEVIICDNASTDRTPDIAREFVARDSRVRYVRNQTNVGAIPNFELSLGLATGKYFTWTAADDSRPPDAIAACVDALERDTTAVMAHGPIAIELASGAPAAAIGNQIDLSSGTAARRVKAFTADLQHVAMLFGLHRREVLRTVRYGNHVGGDYFVCLLMCERGPAAWVPSPILTYRHQYGALDNPMYERQPLTLRDLLLHRGLRRRKCWMVLGIGASYLWQQSAAQPWTDRLGTAAAFAWPFAVRFRALLATECVFIFFTPAAWVAAPFVPMARRFKRARHSAPSLRAR